MAPEGRVRAILLIAGATLAAALVDRPARADDDADPGDLGRPCDEAFFKPCPGGLVCVNNRCAPGRADEADVTETSTLTAPAATPKKKAKVKEPREREVRALRLGVQSAFWLGVGGALSNPRPGSSLVADFGFPTGRRARWHVELGYEDLNGYTGFRVNPFVLGYAIPVLRRGELRLEVEVVAAIVQSEILFHDGFAISLSSGLRGQLVASYGVGFAAFAPLGFEVRYAYGLQDIGIDTGVGVNWPMVLTVGLEL